MPAYGVFVPSSDLNGPELAEAAIFVADGFSWPAFYLGPLWCIWQRTWFGLFLWALAVSILLTSLLFSYISLWGFAAALNLLTFILALEAGALVRRSLERRGMLLIDWTIAPNKEQAARQFLDRQILIEPALRPRPSIKPAFMAQRPDHSHGVGLFTNNEWSK